MAIIPKIYLDSVVSIGVKGQNGKIIWIGTGFYVYRKTKVQNRVNPFLVSNKHVFSGNNEIYIRMRGRDNNKSKLHEVKASLTMNNKPLYHTHNDSQVDVAVLPLYGPYIEQNKFDFFGFDIDDNAMTLGELRENGVDEGSIVYMLGYPMGLVNINSNLPLCRMGCIARMSEEQIKEAKVVLIDVQNFPGNSGSPIILRPELISITGTKSLSKSVLVGIVNSYIPYNETLKSTQTGNIVEVRQENSGIAKMFPVEYIRDIIDTIFPKQEEQETQKS